ncbi:MAG TPA: beta-propeller fold lactonase family protein [Terriglobales bacterium]|jgi:YVTN family beta-propeller protein
MRMKFFGLAGLVALLVASISCSNNNSNTTNPPPSGTAYLYLTTQADNKITPYVVDLSTGKPDTNGNALDTGSRPSAILLDPSGKDVFVLNSDSGDISAYTINADGTLKSAGAPVSTGWTDPVSMTMDAGGKFIFVANRGVFNSVPSKISVFAVSGSGLTPVAGSPFATAINPAAPPPLNTFSEMVAVAVTPDGGYLYAAHKNDNVVTIYSVDASGVPTPILSAEPVGVAPAGVTVSPDGNFLYVANSGTSSNISGFRICDNVSSTCTVPDGSLTAMGTSPFAAGLGPIYMATDPSTKFLYAVDQQSNQISSYTISPVSGELVGASTPTFSTPANPSWIAVSPDGNYVYVANQGASSMSPLKINTSTGVLGNVEAAIHTGGQPSAIVLKLKQ